MFLVGEIVGMSSYVVQTLAPSIVHSPTFGIISFSVYPVSNERHIISWYGNEI